jgi:predicted permease
MSDRFEGRPPRKLPWVPVKPAAEVDSELRFHLEKRINANIAAGMTPDAARRAALERFGDVASVRDECAKLLSEERKTQARRDWFADLSQDVRFAARSALHAPLFSLLAIVTLALGIGANAAVFGVVKSVLLNSIPYRNPERLMRIYSPLRTISDSRGFLSAGTISDLRERSRSFASSGAFLLPRDVTYTGGDVPRVMQAQWVEPSFFTTLGVPFMLGANFRPEDTKSDTAWVTILSYGAWQNLFGGARDVIGKTVLTNGIAKRVIAVLPRDFVSPEGDADFYYGFDLKASMRDPIEVRGSHNFGMVARLRPGVTPELADRELNTIGVELERLYPKDNLGIGLIGKPLRDDMVGDTRTPLLVLLASAVLVLLITCANLAGALVTRTISRRKEFAVRIALGAGRGRLVRQLLTESTLLAVAGGVAGVVLALGLLALLRGLSLEVIPRYADLTLDTGALIVTFALTLLTGLGFGIGPAMAVGRADPQRTLRDETRGSTESVRSRQMRGLLVAGQIALCVSLLTAAGLLARSLWEMMTAPLGFKPDKLLTFTVQLPRARYRTAQSHAAFHSQFSDRLRALPGVTGVANMVELPTTMGIGNGLFVEERPWGPGEPVPIIRTAIVSDDYFRTLGIPVKQGRTFNTTDAMDAPPVIVISEAMAAKYWPKGNAVGSRMRYGPPDPNQPWVTVVGIVGNVRNNLNALGAESIMFLPLRQSPFGETFVVRTAGEPEALVNTVRGVLREIDPLLPMYRVSTMQSVIDGRLAARRLPVMLMMGFGGLALLLASVGIYAMFASMASAREREFGVRMALGSSRRAVAGLVLRQGGVWMALGLILGAAGVAAAARLVRTQLYGVPELDPIAISAAVLILLVCAVAALLMPVRRATRVDPITVLR